MADIKVKVGQQNSLKVVSAFSGDASISVSCSFSNNELFTGSNAFFDYNVSFITDEIRYGEENPFYKTKFPDDKTRWMV